MVAMARALMGRPRVVCMDEPTMGLSPLFVDRVLELIQTVNQQGVTVFMVEQNAHLALQIADYGYVLQTGRIVLSGPARDLLHDPRIRDAYLGRQARSGMNEHPAGQCRRTTRPALARRARGALCARPRTAGDAAGQGLARAARASRTGGRCSMSRSSAPACRGSRRRSR